MFYHCTFNMAPKCIQANFILGIGYTVKTLYKVTLYTEYSITDINLQGTDLFPKYSLLITGYSLNDTVTLYIEYSITDINLQGTDLFPSKFPLYNRIFT